MKKTTITELTVVPKYNDPDAAAKLRLILARHRKANMVDGLAIADTSEIESDVRVNGQRYKIIACATLAHKALYSFTAGGKCVVQSLGNQLTIYKSWAGGYKRLVHDIYYHWAQLVYDANLSAQPYKLLYSRLT
jgi:hypothetical protein